MRYKILLLALAILLLIPTVSAISNETIISAWINETDVCGGFDLTVSGATRSASSGCANGDCYNYDGINDELFVSDYNVAGSKDFTVSLWANSTELRQQHPAGHYMTWADTGATEAINAFWASGDLGYLQVDPGVSQSYQPGNTTTMNHWIFIVNSSLHRVYLNSVQIVNISAGGAVAHVGTNQDMYIGNRANGVGNDEVFNGTIDEIYLYNRTLNQSEIDDLYNSGSGEFINPDCTFGAPPPAPSRVITQTFPSVFNETDNVFIQINITDEIINNTRDHNATLTFNETDFIAQIEYNATGVIIFNVTVNTTLIDINETMFFFNWTYNLTENDVRILNTTTQENTTGVYAYLASAYTLTAVAQETIGQTITFDLLRHDVTVPYTTLMYFNNTLIRSNVSATASSYSNAIVTPLIDTTASTPNINITTNLTFTYAGKSVTRLKSGNQSITTIRLSNFTVPPIKAETELQGVAFNLDYQNATLHNYTLYHNVTNVYENLSIASGTFWNNSFYTPIITGNPSTILVNLTTNYTVSFNGTTLVRTSNQQTQNVTTISVTNCTLASNPEIILLGKYENSPTINRTVDVNLNIVTYSSDISENLTTGFTLADRDHYGLCFNWVAGTFFVESTMTYTGVDMDTRNYFLVNATFEANESTNITLFMINDSLSSNIIVSLRDKDNQPMTGHYIEMLRFYESESLLRTVEISRCDSSNAECLLHAQANDVFYQFIIKNPDGAVLEVTEPDKIVQSELTIQVVIDEEFIEALEQIDEISTSLTFNNVTRIATLIFSDTNNIASTVELRARRLTARGEETVCRSTTTSSSGTLFCAVGNQSSEIIIQAMVTQSNGDVTPLSVIRVITSDVTLSGLGIMLWIMLAMVMIGMGTFNPTASIIFGIVALSGGVIFGLISFSMSMVFMVSLVGVFLVVRMRT